MQLFYWTAADELYSAYGPEKLYAATYVSHVNLVIRYLGAGGQTVTETERELTMDDVDGQKSEWRKWVHCFPDVSTILFLVSLSGYDRCLVEDKCANQMQDAMGIWELICHSQWFKYTSIILFLNKNDLFEKKIPQSNIKNFFPDFDGEPGDVYAGSDYFKHRFLKLATKADPQNEREIFIHMTTTVDTSMLRVVMAAMEGTFPPFSFYSTSISDAASFRVSAFSTTPSPPFPHSRRALNLLLSSLPSVLFSGPTLRARCCSNLLILLLSISVCARSAFFFSFPLLFLHVSSKCF
ncbi:G-protein alpha subunit-domain-containing protein [Armillaria novae-zelandiae]|uniref:G-protein alpha subunit-domain-containing protein n=1 Tax=Armillaria novae-zelandiae TaxID=153914 RepID=A0AA39P8C9_9AGAR|nr:G-protein alpha subunit-domain-containing protein [Armillaria novae-zelandiae]